MFVSLNYTFIRKLCVLAEILIIFFKIYSILDTANFNNNMRTKKITYLCNDIKTTTRLLFFRARRGGFFFVSSIAGTCKPWHLKDFILLFHWAPLPPLPFIHQTTTPSMKQVIILSITDYAFTLWSTSSSLSTGQLHVCRWLSCLSIKMSRNT